MQPFAVVPEVGRFWLERGLAGLHTVQILACGNGRVDCYGAIMVAGLRLEEACQDMALRFNTSILSSCRSARQHSLKALKSTASKLVPASISAASGAFRSKPVRHGKNKQREEAFKMCRHL